MIGVLARGETQAPQHGDRVRRHALSSSPISDQMYCSLSRCFTLTKLISFLNTVLPTNELSPYRPNEKEQQMILMILTQVLVTVLCQFPSSIFQVYAVVTQRDEKSYERLVVELFVYNSLVLILFLPACLSFYVYFITTRGFRKECLSIVKSMLRLER